MAHHVHIPLGLRIPEDDESRIVGSHRIRPRGIYVASIGAHNGEDLCRYLTGSSRGMVAKAKSLTTQTVVYQANMCRE